MDFSRVLRHSPTTTICPYNNIEKCVLFQRVTEEKAPTFTQLRSFIYYVSTQMNSDTQHRWLIFLMAWVPSFNSVPIRVSTFYSFAIHITTKFKLASINDSKLSCLFIEKLCYLSDSKFWNQRTRKMNTWLEIGGLQQIRGSDSLWMV